jgi:hypothetical protein
MERQMRSQPQARAIGRRELLIRRRGQVLKSLTNFDPSNAARRANRQVRADGGGLFGTQFAVDVPKEVAI